MPKRAHFAPALFDFLRQLKKNNNRDWFLANKARYEADVREPAQRFIEDAGPSLRKISKHLVADPRPVGGSLFRINRDIRFSKDKSPYKTAVGISFYHDQGSHQVAPGYYLQLEPGTSFAGGGIHMADNKTLNQVRDLIVAEPATWKKLTQTGKFAPMYTYMGESLKRAPQGYDPEHPLVEDLKRKGYGWHAMYTEEQVTSADFLDRYVADCKLASPFSALMATGLGVDW
ncbi:MAG: DUF2461 domain-containing protein [Candidatus Dormibacteraeota bacterium]|nr:DUF2461 domain-containing protein [Candidatus Dormibacteraeota bacterium]